MIITIITKITIIIICLANCSISMTLSQSSNIKIEKVLKIWHKGLN